MPRLRPDLALCAFLACGLFSACSTSGMGLDDIAPTASLVDADDPVLPDSVAVHPSPSDASDEAEPVIVAAAYAAPSRESPATEAFAAGKVEAGSPELDALIARYAGHHQIPEELLRRVVKRESTFNPAARNGPYWGLMQILPQTAHTMGYKGPPEGLLDAETNLKYAGKYLRGAYLVADGDHDLAVRYYARGYYYDAKRRGMLAATGLGKDRRRMH